MARNRFTDPKTAKTYDWSINHKEESDATGKERNISYGGNTGETGLVAQQADDSPLEFHVRGAILEEAQHEEFIDWFILCRTQTILFRDFAGDEYEVQMTSYKPTRKRTIKNSRGGSTNPLHWFEYEMVLTVKRVISGPWLGVVA